MTVPKLQILWRRHLKNDNDILFGWIASDSTVKSYNLYQSFKADGPYILLKAGILNIPSKEKAYKGKIIYRTFDSVIPIASGHNHYFKLTVVTNIGESDIDDSDPIIVHPPQVNNENRGEDTDNYIYNHCWDAEHQKWVKGRVLARSEYITTTIGLTEQLITFDDDIYGLEIQNTSDEANVWVNLNGESIAINGGMLIDPKQYYTAGRLVKAVVGIMIKSSVPDTNLIIVGHS